MKLTELKIKNFRCYQEEITLTVNDLTAIIGKNDVGKSSILEALDAFFNGAIDAGDLSIGSSNQTILIGCKFSGLPEQVVLDTSEPTSPAEEGILNEQGMLEVEREFTFGGKMSKATYVWGNLPEDERLENLLRLKNPSLKSLAESLEVNLKGVSKSKNPALRRAIRNHLGSVRVRKRIKVEGGFTSEDNIKGIWESLSKHLPIYTLFKADRTLSDKDEGVQDPMKLAIKEALSIPEIAAMLETVQQKVQQEVTKVAEETIKRLEDIDSALAQSLHSEFSRDPSYSSVFSLNLLDQNNVPVNKRGTGIRRLILLSFFQAQAERRKMENNAPSIIYALEEPESSQHPNHQMILIKSLIRLSERENIQVLFTTHSGNLVREIPTAALRFVWRDDGGLLRIDSGEREDGSEDTATIDGVKNTLGLLPNPADRVKVLLFVEGPYDVEVLKLYSKLLSESEAYGAGVPNLTTCPEVGYVVTGGSTLKDYINKGYLRELGKPEVHIYDGDVGSYSSLVQRMNDQRDPNRVGFTTQKNAIENYLHHQAIMEAFIVIHQPITIDPVEDDEDVPLKASVALATSRGVDWDTLSDEDKKDKKTKRKRLLNTLAVEKMTIELLDERNGIEEMRRWFLTIGRHLG